MSYLYDIDGSVKVREDFGLATNDNSIGTHRTRSYLLAGEYIFSSDKRLMLIYDFNGKLVVYKLEQPNESVNFNQASESVSDISFIVLDQGNSLIKYPIRQLWSSRANLPQGIDALGVQLYGSALIFVGKHKNNHKMVYDQIIPDRRSFASPFRLTLQKDGNLVIYDAANTWLWASNTNTITNYTPPCTVTSC
jgi:hypothetical protein